MTLSSIGDRRPPSLQEPKNRVYRPVRGGYWAVSDRPNEANERCEQDRAESGSRGSDRQFLSPQPGQPLHVIGEIGEADLGSGAGEADGADEQSHRPFLPGEDMLDCRAHCRFAGVGPGGAARHRFALEFLADGGARAPCVAGRSPLSAPTG